MEALSAEELLELELFNIIDPPLAGRIEIMLAKIGAAICNRLVSESCKAEDFYTDYSKLAEELLERLDKPEKQRQRTAEDIANEWRGMGFSVEIAKRES